MKQLVVFEKLSIVYSNLSVVFNLSNHVLLLPWVYISSILESAAVLNLIFEAPLALTV